MTKTLLLASLAALTCWSCKAPCQDFYTLPRDEPGRNTKLGLGYAVSLVVNSGEGELDVTGTLPPGLQLTTVGVKTVLTGTPTEVGHFEASVWPRLQACEFEGKSYGNFVLQYDVVPAECESDQVCNLFTRDNCAQSSGCLTRQPYNAAACVHAVGDAGVCVDALSPGDVCSGAISATTVTSVEGNATTTCIADPLRTGCNNHVCYGAPDAG